MDRHRQRRREGLRCIFLSVRETEIATLVSLGLLSAQQVSDQRAIAKAMGKFLDRALGKTPC
jgi:hypothetical protein